jgi:hypothetical protein
MNSIIEESNGHGVLCSLAIMTFLVLFKISYENSIKFFFHFLSIGRCQRCMDGLGYHLIQPEEIIHGKTLQQLSWDFPQDSGRAGRPMMVPSLINCHTNSCMYRGVQGKV